MWQALNCCKQDEPFLDEEPCGRPTAHPPKPRGDSLPTALLPLGLHSRSTRRHWSSCNPALWVSVKQVGCSSPDRPTPVFGELKCWGSALRLLLSTPVSGEGFYGLVGTCTVFCAEHSHNSWHCMTTSPHTHPTDFA
jgi:hypothetical protein